MQELQETFRQLKNNGYTLQEIANRYNISRQRVHQIMYYDFKREKAPVPVMQQIIYPNLKKWLKDNNMAPKELAKNIGMPYYSLYSIIIGKTKSPQRKVAIQIADYVGMDIDTLFKKNNTLSY